LISTLDLAAISVDKEGISTLRETPFTPDAVQITVPNLSVYRFDDEDHIQDSFVDYVEDSCSSSIIEVVGNSMVPLVPTSDHSDEKFQKAVKKVDYLISDVDSDDSLVDCHYSPNEESTENESDDIASDSELVSSEGVENQSTNLKVCVKKVGGNCNSKLSFFPKKHKAVGVKKVYDKVNFCTFCGIGIHSKISRHLLRVHKNEEQILEILLQQKRSKNRINMLNALANEGNFKHNIEALRTGKGQVVVARRSEHKKVSDYVACEFCKKFQSKRNMWRHSRTCQARPDYSQEHQQDNDGKKKRTLAVKGGKALVSHALFEENEDVLIELIGRMRDGDVKEVVVADALIRKEACLRMSSLGRKQDQKEDDIYRVSQAARTLARIVLLARETRENTTLDELVVPHNFDLVVDIAKKLSTDKESPSLNVGKYIGHLLVNVCLSKYCAALRNGDQKGKEDAMDFRKLIEREWNSRVNRAAMRRISKEKRNKMPSIPLTDDLKTFRNFLIKGIREKSERVRKSCKASDWIELAKMVMTRLILFNKRRRTEVREMRVDEYLARPKWNEEQGGEMMQALSPVNQQLAKR
jgi:hypothetical protein